MKTTVPENLKADLPPSRWGKVLSSTPVVLAVVSTMLAGLASSEMTKAQYERSFAAQLQAKAGDQWGFFQAKRLRSALQSNTLDLMSATAAQRPLDRAALVAAVKAGPSAPDLTTPAAEQALVALAEGRLPKAASAPAVEAPIRAALEALETFQPDATLNELLVPVSDESLRTALRLAREAATGLDDVLKPVGRVIDGMEKQLEKLDSSASPRRDFITARVRYNSARYDAEARLNQGVATLLELQVRKTNLTAERHHRRSQKFFFGMLAAQTGVIVSTLAIAARKRNLLWTLAAVAGGTAIAFATWVYLYV